MFSFSLDKIGNDFMKLLLIGNGFDLAHGLPTSYKDFLEFCKIVKWIYSPIEHDFLRDFSREDIDGWDTNSDIKKIVLDAFEKRIVRKRNDNDKNADYIETPNNALNELYLHIKENTWLEYFEEESLKLGNNWIDFESEISKVIQALDSGRYQIENGGSVTNVEGDCDKKIVSLLKASKKNLKAVTTIDGMDDFVVFLNGELERLIRSLEIYISEFINKIHITHKCEDIENLSVDSILSFNYSNTYQRVYDNESSLQYDYIHGKANISKNVETCDLVLGIDEYLDEEWKNSRLEFLSFKKYYQRIYKTTENKYLKWIDEIKDDYFDYQEKKNNAYETTIQSIKDGSLGNYPFQKTVCSELLNVECKEHELYVFGHSLDVSDRDILRLFICNDNVQTKIFYYRKTQDDKTSLGKIIKNLIKIIGQDELIRRTGGLHKTIEFIPQSLNKE